MKPWGLPPDFEFPIPMSFSKDGAPFIVRYPGGATPVKRGKYADIEIEHPPLAEVFSAACDCPWCGESGYHDMVAAPTRERIREQSKVLAEWLRLRDYVERFGQQFEFDVIRTCSSCRGRWGQNVMTKVVAR